MSRSVTMPATRPPSVTITLPMSPSRISRAASTRLSPISTVRGSRVMISSTVRAIRSHLLWLPGPSSRTRLLGDNEQGQERGDERRHDQAVDGGGERHGGEQRDDGERP